MFSKLLIANRGEIAVRIIRSCKEMGIDTVAIYSDLDRDAMHVRMADEAYSIGGKTAAESYLNVDAVCEIISKSGAEAVHPGYGFFSENAEFVGKIVENGVAFVGPPVSAIEKMGDKLSARKVAQDAKVQSVPGNTENITSTKQIQKFADEHGWPIALKAAYGGGGRGMKMLEGPEEMEDALESARREAESYFGRGEIYLEKYLTWPRHVEIQIMADSQGNHVYLGSRDCSAQRRHQKLIEEAPAPDIDEKILTKMGEAAMSISRECGYTNAGTLEFLYQDGEFYFLEMNTRLQVEHPATELVTGIDLVAEQIRVASGMPLGFAQKDIAIDGHAIEVRINAEEPANGAFLPTPGKITELSVPDGFGVRFDSGYAKGDEISEYYDNLLGKLICWGKNRDEAIARTLRALKELRVEGVATTIPADIAILENEEFAQVNHSTRWVAEKLDLGNIAPAVSPGNATGAGAADERHDVSVEINGKRFSVALWMEGETNSSPATTMPSRPRARKSTSEAQGGSSSGEVVVPMQGTVIKIMAEEGSHIEVGEPLLVLEAMKMENNVNAPCSGTVQKISVSVGDAVGSGDVVALIE